QKQISNLPREKGHYLNQNNQIFMESQNIITVESQEEWTEDELVEFERYTLGPQEQQCEGKKKINDEENTKGIKKLETFFQPSSLTTSQLICQESYISESLSLYLSPIIIPDSSLWSTENLRIRLEELNQRYSIGKSVKEN
ncbi:21108_t:CDS:2, partial [Racocetra persica]